MRWRIIEGHSNYAIDADGVVINIITGMIIKTKMRGGNSKTKPKGKYKSVSLQGKTYSIHSLVATHFIGPRPDGLVVCHNDGDCLNNHVSNLRYDTQANNNKDKLKHGTASIRPTNKMLDHMFIAASQGISIQKIAQRYGVHRNWPSLARRLAKSGEYILPEYAIRDYR